MQMKIKAFLATIKLLIKAMVAIFSSNTGTKVEQQPEVRFIFTEPDHKTGSAFSERVSKAASLDTAKKRKKTTKNRKSKKGNKRRGAK